VEARAAGCGALGRWAPAETRWAWTFAAGVDSVEVGIITGAGMNKVSRGE